MEFVAVALRATRTRPTGTRLQRNRRRSTLLFQQTRCEFKRRFAFPAKHPRDFFLARFAGDFMQIGKCAATRNVFRHDKVRRSGRGDLRQMRDADHLMITPQHLHLGANRVRDFAADIRIDLVEH